MVDSEPLRSLKPVVLLGGEGWLGEQLARQQVPVITTSFPSPRSFAARVFGLGFFARRVRRELERRSIRISAIVANDHQECPLALALAQASGGVPVLAILRTPGMSRRDFQKYQCERCDGLMGEGAELRQRLTKWTEKPVALFEEGFVEAEFMPPKPGVGNCPTRLIVIGSEAPRKGFTDFIRAVDEMEAKHPDFRGFHCDFTGTAPAGSEALLAQQRRSSFQFLGRVEGFAQLVRQYDLAVHPSRAETFGMAPIEAMLAGTPTLVSVTGVVGELGLPPAWTFPPGDIASLAERLSALWKQWPELALDLEGVQAQIRKAYHIDHTAGFVRDALAALRAPAHLSQ
jgi:hypothetical protein